MTRAAARCLRPRAVVRLNRRMTTRSRTILVPAAVAAIAILVALVGGAQAAGLMRGSVTSREIKDRSIKTIDLALGSVNAGAIRAGAVTEARLANGSVTSAKLAAGSVTSDKLAAGAVTAAMIADGTITAAQLGTNSVGADEVQSGAVGTLEIADGAVTSAKLAPSVRATMDGVWARTENNPGTALAGVGTFTEYLGGSTYDVPERRVQFGATITIQVLPANNAAATCRLKDGAFVVSSVPASSVFVGPSGAFSSIQLAGIVDVADGTFAPSVECSGVNANVTTASAHFVGLAGAQATIS